MNGGAKVRVSIPVEEILKNADPKVRYAVRKLPISAHGMAFWLSVPEFEEKAKSHINHNEQITSTMALADMREIFDARFSESKNGGRAFCNYRVGLSAIKELEKALKLMA